MPPRDPSRRRRILDVARRQFTERGFRGTRLDDVAEEAGCAKGALYLEFADKESLLREVADEAFTAIRARFVAEVVSIDSPLGRLRETLRFAFRQFAAEPLFSRLLREDPELKALGIGTRSEDAGAARAQFEQIVGWVEEGVARGEIRPDVDRDVIPMVLGVLRFAPQHVQLAGMPGLPAAERVLEAIADIFAAGLAARPTAPPRPPRKKLRTR